MLRIIYITNYNDDAELPIVFIVFEKDLIIIW